MMKKSLNRGFTLIELLVVIAIIGILASVVLASLNSARDKGSDAAVKSSINNVRAQAELFYDDQNPKTYVGVCADSTVVNIQQAVNNAGGTFVCTATSSARYAISSVLISDTSEYYCVDSTGKATTTATNPGSNMCP